MYGIIVQTQCSVQQHCIDVLSSVDAACTCSRHTPDIITHIKCRVLKPLDCLRSSPSSPSSPSVEATSLLFPSSRSTHNQFAASTMSARLVLQSTAIVFLAHLPPTLRNFLSLEGASAPLTTTTVHNRKVVDHRVCLLLLSVAVSSASTPAPGQGHSVYSLARAARAHCHKNFTVCSS